MTPPTLDDRTVDGAHDANGAKKRKMSIAQHQYSHFYKDMNTSMVKSKFLSNPEHLGVVAVGFKGGQVHTVPYPFESIFFLPMPTLSP